jgi:two-component system, sensor histidine kinase FlrB
MLPSPHILPINDEVNGTRADLKAHDWGEDLLGWGDQFGGEIKLGAESNLTNGGPLTDAFVDFIQASSQLENSYRDLQKEVYGLSCELADRNDALKLTLEENEHIRIALQQIVDSMPCGVLVVERNGEISLINPKSEQMLGLDRMPVEGRSVLTLNDIGIWSGINLSIACQGAPSHDRGQEFCIHDGAGKRWLEVRTSHLFNRFLQQGTQSQTIFILQDITAQKLAESERDSSRRAMALAEISTILAHEIRNPLASLELFAELIEQDGEHATEWISNLRAGIRSLSGTVNNVLSFHGTGSLHLSSISLSKLVSNSIEFVRPLANQAGVSLLWSDAGGATMIMGNNDSLRQVILNLIANAIRHTPSGGSIAVTSLAADKTLEGSFQKEILVQFSDTGCGIRPDQIARVLEPGFSGSGDTSGLGLAVCDRIMKLHGGKVSAGNLPFGGAQFVLHFPIPDGGQRTV